MKLGFRWFSIFTATIALSAGLLAQSTSPLKKKHPKASAQPAATQQDLQTLRDLVQAQQKQIETQSQQVQQLQDQQLQDQLHQVLDSVQQANANSQKLQSGDDQAQATATQAQQSAAEAQRLADQASSTAAEARSAVAQTDVGLGKKVQNLENGLKKVGPFNFSGDFRLRDEPFFGGPSDQSQVRNRERFRFQTSDPHWRQVRVSLVQHRTNLG